MIYCSCMGQPNDIGNWKTERGNNQRTNYVDTNITRKEPEIKWKKKIALANTPVVADGIVYFSDEDSYFYALDIQSENELWKIKTESPVSRTVIDDNDIIYLAERKKIFALERKTGKLVWKKEDMSSMDLKVQDNLIYIRSYFKSEKGNDHLIALDTKTGNEVWRFSDSSYLDIPIINNGILYISGIYQSKLHALNAQTGTELWSIDNQHRGNLIVTEGKILLFSSYVVYALDEKNGTELWRYKLDNYCTILGASNKVVYIASRNSISQIVEIHTLNIQTGETELIKKYESADLFTFAAASDDTVVFGINSLKEDLSGSAILYALNPQNGDEIWSKKLDDVLINPEIIILNNMIMFKTGQMKGLWNLTQDEYDGDYLYLLK